VSSFVFGSRPVVGSWLAAHLLHKHGHAGGSELRDGVSRPLDIEGSGMRSGFSADYYPVNSGIYFQVLRLAMLTIELRLRPYSFAISLRAIAFWSQRLRTSNT